VTMDTSGRLRVLLQPGGQHIVAETAGDPAACWQVVGSTRQDGMPMSFVRAEIGGATWAATIPTAWLRRPGQGTMVTLIRQSPVEPPPLLGWEQFC
jgi:hypothetical protein